MAKELKEEKLLLKNILKTKSVWILFSEYFSEAVFLI